MWLACCVEWFHSHVWGATFCFRTNYLLFGAIHSAPPYQACTSRIKVAKRTLLDASSGPTRHAISECSMSGTATFYSHGILGKGTNWLTFAAGLCGLIFLTSSRRRFSVAPSWDSSSSSVSLVRATGASSGLWQVVDASYLSLVHSRNTSIGSPVW